jgi:solute carrier family 25 carnitine/acylcarnitine transporter 20/29
MSQTTSEAKITLKKVNPIKDFLAGGVGGACLVITGHPLDTIKVSLKKKISFNNKNLINNSKVRLQTQTKPQPGQVLLYTGTLDCAKKIVAKEVKTIEIKSERFF